MIGVNMSNVESAGTYQRPKPGGYVIRITSVTNNKQKERLDIEFDIAEGEFAGYYKDMQERAGWHTGKFSKSYKAKALPFFKGFIKAVVDSNKDVSGLIVGDFEDVDETRLDGKLVGMAVGEKEYIGNDGQKKTRLDTYNAVFLAADDIRSGNYTVPEFQPLQEAPQSTGVVDTTAFGPVSDEDVQF